MKNCISFGALEALGIALYRASIDVNVMKLYRLLSSLQDEGWELSPSQPEPTIAELKMRSPYATSEVASPASPSDEIEIPF